MSAGVWDPRPDVSAAARVGDVLRDLGYEGKVIDELLGDDGAAAGADDVVVFSRRLPDDELGHVIRLLHLQQRIETSDALVALGHGGVGALLAIGIVVEEGGALVPRGRIVPTQGLLLAFDGFSQGVHDPPGWVAGFTPTAYWLASLTPRPRGARALDVGTGNGIQALLAAGHCGRVIATDVNPRALAFTTLNAALNGIENVETRLGSLFDPVAGGTFDLITCNAPYVVSPRPRWQYRDAGLPGDELSEQVVRHAAAHLASDGYASLIVSWLGESEDEPDEHVHEWLGGSGCDAWLLGLRGADPLDHAADWNEHLVDVPSALEDAIDEWEAYLRGLGAGWVTEGAVLLHKRRGEGHLTRADPVDEEDLEQAGDQIERLFAGLALLAGGDDALAGRRFRLAKDVWFQQELDRSGAVTSTTIALDEGTHPELELEPELVPVLTARRGASVDAVGPDLLRELLELGFLEV